MNSDDFLKLLGSGGIGAVVVYIGARWGWSVIKTSQTMQQQFNERLVAAVDRIGVKIDEHTTKDVAAWTDVGNKISHLEGRLTGRKITAVDGVPIVEPRRDTPRGGYRQAGSHHDGDDDGR